MGKLIPILLALIGLGAGIGGGLMLRPEHSETLAECPCDCNQEGQVHEAATEPDPEAEPGEPTSDFVKMNNQFVIPVVSGEDVGALVVMAISLEVTLGQSGAVYQREPKLRDAYLQVLFDHANAGGFDGAFTSGSKMTSLRQALLEVSKAELGSLVLDVLITDIARQDT